MGALSTDPRTVILDDWVGLRPGRDGDVRLEAESISVAGSPSRPLRVIHCYGHGGCGHSLHWGCAREVVALAVRERQAGGALAAFRREGLPVAEAFDGPQPVLLEGLMTAFPRAARVLGRTGLHGAALAARTGHPGVSDTPQSAGSSWPRL